MDETTYLKHKVPPLMSESLNGKTSFFFFFFLLLLACRTSLRVSTFLGGEEERFTVAVEQERSSTGRRPLPDEVTHKEPHSE
jgi:hypothetical protein